MSVLSVWQTAQSSPRRTTEAASHVAIPKASRGGATTFPRGPLRERFACGVRVALRLGSSHACAFRCVHFCRGDWAHIPENTPPRASSRTNPLDERECGDEGAFCSSASPHSAPLRCSFALGAPSVRLPRRLPLRVGINRARQRRPRLRSHTTCQVATQARER